MISITPCHSTTPANSLIGSQQPSAFSSTEIFLMQTKIKLNIKTWPVTFFSPKTWIGVNFTKVKSWGRIYFARTIHCKVRQLGAVNGIIITSNLDSNNFVIGIMSNLKSDNKIRFRLKVNANFQTFLIEFKTIKNDKINWKIQYFLTIWIKIIWFRTFWID